jgi:hypothetical protein
MHWLTTFNGQIGPWRYALASASILLSQYLLVWLIFGALSQDLTLDWLFYVMPLRTMSRLQHPGTIPFVVAVVHMLIASWVLAALAFRRARSAGIGGWVSALVITPTLQLPIILFLCLAPAKANGLAETDIQLRQTLGLVQATRGVLAGLGVTLSAVILGALVFGSYGYGIFYVTPFIVGTVTAYIGNSKGDIGTDQTLGMVISAAFLGGVLLLGVALEGIVCLLMAVPIALPVAILGGMLGRALALHRTRRRPVLMSVAALPIAFAVEAVMPPVADFDTCQTVEIDAPTYPSGEDRRGSGFAW